MVLESFVTVSISDLWIFGNPGDETESSTDLVTWRAAFAVGAAIATRSFISVFSVPFFVACSQ